MTDDILYLGAADIAALALGPAAILDAVEDAFREKAAGRSATAPKLAVEGGAGLTAQAMVAIAGAPAVSALKWLGISATNPGRGLPPIHATVMLNDTATGMPRTIMNGTWLTGVRTAACSAAAARRLARPESETVAFVGCGLQAHTHLAALRAVLPGLRRAVLLGRSAAPVERLARAAAAAGLVAEVAPDAAAALRAADVVVSSVPAAPGLVPFLDAALLRPGVFVAAVDLGRSWAVTDWRRCFALLATDDPEQSAALGAAGKMAYGGPFDAGLAELVSGGHPGRADEAQRAAMVFAGSALADLGLAVLIDREARRRGIGRFLPA